MILDWHTRLLWTGQLLTEGADGSQQVVIVPSGSQVAIALVTGLLMAFAFQLLLANFGIAVGITALSLRPGSSSNDNDPDDTQVAESKPVSLSKTLSRVSLVAGSGVLLSIDAVLFAACFLAVRLSLVNDLISGAIIGIIIWSTYCLLLTWISSSAAGFLTNTVLNTATSGLRNLLTTVSAAFSSDSTPQATPVEPTEPQELRADLDSLDLEAILKDYLNTFQPPKPDLGSVQQKLSQLLENPTLKSLANSPLQTMINRQTFTDWVNRYTDFSDHETEQVVDQLDTIWNQIRSQDLSKDQVEELLNSFQSRDLETLEALPNGDSKQASAKPASESPSANPLALLQQVDIKTLMQTALNRVDLSDWDIEKVWHQLQPLRHRLTNQAVEGQVSTEPFNIIRVDVENYLLNAHPWHLNSNALKSELKQILYDPEAAPAQIQPLLEQLNRDQFAHILNQRNDLASEQINQIADQLEAVRNEVLAAVEPPQVDPAQIQAATTDLWQKLQSYLRYTSLSKLDSANIKHKLQTLIAESQLSPTVLGTQLPGFDPNALSQVLERRQGLKFKAREQLLDQIQAAWADLVEVSPAAQTEDNDDLLRVMADYLQELDWSNLSLEDIKQDVIKLLDDPQQGTLALRRRVTHLDWSALGDRLTQRQDLNQAQIKQVLDQVGEGIRQIVKPPRRWAIRAQKASEDLQAQVEDYLLHREKAEFNPEGVRRDLQRILDHSGTGSLKQIWQTKIIGDTSHDNTLPTFEQSRLKDILQQRQDITAAEVNQIIDQVDSTWTQLLEQAQQTQDQLQSTLDQVLSAIRTSLNTLELPKLDAEAIQQELRQLFNSPQAGLGKLRDAFDSFLQGSSLETLPENSLDAIRERLNQLSHDGIETLLRTREDLSGEVPSQLIEQIEQVRDQMLEQVETLQQSVQNRIEEFKQQAQQKAAAVRSAAAIAAWWLFGIAFSSLCVAAAAGALAVITNRYEWGASV